MLWECLFQEMAGKMLSKRKVPARFSAEQADCANCGHSTFDGQGERPPEVLVMTRT
jgi:hypothetical protein